MIYALDTSVLVRILSNAPLPLAADVIMDIWHRRKNGDEFIVSNLVLSEAYYAMQQHYGVDKKTVLNALRILSEQPGFLFSQEAKSALALENIDRASPGFVDRLIHGEQHSKGLKVLSGEKSFRKLPDTEILPSRER